jgi:hypothetical protein
MRGGWLCLAVACCCVAYTAIRGMNLALGQDHICRIDGRWPGVGEDQFCLRRLYIGGCSDINNDRHRNLVCAYSSPMRVV